MQGYTRDDASLILKTAKQQNSALVRALALATGMTDEDRSNLRHHESQIHFHDSSTSELAWNDVQAVRKWNEYMNEDLQEPVVASEGYNRHYHTSEYDGGWIPGMGPHDHRDQFNGGFAFAVYHPGTDLPQQPWAV